MADIQAQAGEAKRKETGIIFMTEFINKILTGQALENLKRLPDKCLNCCITSPPYYGLRDYGVNGQLGHESSPEEFIERLTEVFMEVHRCMKKDGTLWINIGDSYASQSKNRSVNQAEAKSTLQGRKTVLS